MNNDELYMQIALEEAESARAEGEVPVGAVITGNGEILARDHNRSIAANDPTAHAEICAMRRAAARLGNYRLPGTTLYVTVEPCIMCAGAILHARIARLVYGAPDPKGGGIRSLYRIVNDERLNHSAEVTGGVLEKECGKILSRFFREKRVHTRP